MPINEFKCSACSKAFEIVQSKSTDAYACSCGQQAKRVYRRFSSSIKEITGNEDIDLIVGRDSEVKWDGLHKRRAALDAKRKELGSQKVSINANGEVQATSQERLDTIRELGNAYGEARDSGELVEEV